MLSFVIANAADQRGRSSFAWFLLSILTSPILAALFLLLFPAAPRPVHSYQPDDRTLNNVSPIDEGDQTRGNRASVAILWMIFFILVALGVLIIAKFGHPEHAEADNSSSTELTLSMRPYTVVAGLTCTHILNSLDTSEAPNLIQPVIEFIGQHDDLGTPVNRQSYLLTECRLRESQTVGKAVDNLFEQKRTGRLPQIPIGGATNDAYERAVWVPFDKWVRHKGPRPNISKASGF